MKRIKISHLEAIRDLFGNNFNKVDKSIAHVLDGNTSIPWWLISITGGSGYPIFRTGRMKLVGCLGVLPVSFEDITPTDYDSITHRIPNKNHAEDIIKILDIIKPNERLVVHCEAGISRSAAVAYFAAEYLGLNPDELFEHDRYHPNREVIRLLREAAGFNPLETQNE